MLRDEWRISSCAPLPRKPLRAQKPSHDEPSRILEYIPRPHLLLREVLETAARVVKTLGDRRYSTRIEHAECYERYKYGM